jgi:hypothetical protein
MNIIHHNINPLFDLFETNQTLGIGYNNQWGFGAICNYHLALE